MSKAYFTCKCGTLVEYDTNTRTRLKYCHTCMQKMVDTLVAIEADVDAYQGLYAMVVPTKASRQVRL